MRECQCRISLRLTRQLANLNLHRFGFIAANPSVAITLIGIDYRLDQASVSNTKVVVLDTISLDNRKGDRPKITTIISSQSYPSSSSWTAVGASIQVWHFVSPFLSSAHAFPMAQLGTPIRVKAGVSHTVAVY